jgi:hypothetical protein
MILGCEPTDRASASHRQIVSLKVESSRNLKVLEPLGCFRESLNVFSEPYVAHIRYAHAKVVFCNSATTFS